MSKPILFTTAISYTNGSPHIGHLYESVLADFLKRIYEIKGNKIKLLTGTDEHGKKISQLAQSQGIQPIEICNKYSSEFIQMDKQIQMGWDYWIRTSDPVHKELVSRCVIKSIKSDDIYLSTYKGWYCIKEETYIPELTAKLSNYINPITSKPYELVEEPTFMFKMRSKPNLLDRTFPTYYVKGLDYNPETIEDLSITRTTFDWGIPWPESNSKSNSEFNHVIYVWFDALLNYVTGEEMLYPLLSGSNDLERIHLIGKDIIWFHSIIYPAILKSINHPLPDKILIHGFVLDSNGLKMSKSLGNVIEPSELFKEFSIEAIRFYMIFETVFGSDILFSKYNLISIYNNILLKGFGNLFQRLYNLLRPIQDEINLWIQTNLDIILNYKSSTRNILDKFIDTLDFSIWKLELKTNLDWTNKELTDKKPWTLPIGSSESIEIYGPIVIKFNIVCGLLYPAIPEKIIELIKLIGWEIQDILLSTETINPIKFQSDIAKIIAFKKIDL
jgi:methionyl-tRNA synthetase